MSFGSPSYGSRQQGARTSAWSAPLPLLILPLLHAACASDTSTPTGPREIGVSADLTLATIDSADLPFALSSSESTIVEIVGGNLNLQQGGRFQRQTATRVTTVATADVEVRSDTDVGSYTLLGESIRLAGVSGTLMGTIVAGEATLQVDGRDWVYR